MVENAVFDTPMDCCCCSVLACFCRVWFACWWGLV